MKTFILIITITVSLFASKVTLIEVLGDANISVKPDYFVQNIGVRISDSVHTVCFSKVKTIVEEILRGLHVVDSEAVITQTDYKQEKGNRYSYGGPNEKVLYTTDILMQIKSRNTKKVREMFMLAVNCGATDIPTTCPQSLCQLN